MGNTPEKCAALRLRLFHRAGAETQHWLETALACKYVSEEIHENLMKQCKLIGRMLGKMMANPGPFCGRYTGAKQNSK
jgi:hypothetical protein